MLRSRGSLHACARRHNAASACAAQLVERDRERRILCFDSAQCLEVVVIAGFRVTALADTEINQHRDAFGGSDGPGQDHVVS